MVTPTLSDILKIFEISEGKYWFRNDEGDTLSLSHTDLVSVRGVGSVRTTTHDFTMQGLKIKWVREVILRIPRSDYVEIRGEARVKYEGDWELTPDLVQSRLGLKEPS